MSDSSINEVLLAHCLHHQVIPLKLTDDYLEVAVAENYSAHIEPTLRFLCHRKIKLNIWPKAQIENKIRQLTPLDSTLQKSSVKEDKPEYENQLQDDESVVKFINQVLQHALQQRASDIHFEPYAKSYRIRLRVDGILQETPAPAMNLASRIAARLKIMAQLNIAERRIPQDGQFSITYANQLRALRISTLPVAYGEKIVLRVMESTQQPIDINQLGLPKQLQADYLNTLNSSQGLILVTGPTGSGKTVTLYSGLKHINDGSRNICSVEDPIEIPLEGINQTQVNPKAGLLFSHTLRAFLRQDPDVIMVGEIRDKETARIAIEAAQTGHLVLSTLHTNSTTETLVRLQQMDIPAYLLSTALKMIIAQRLVRCLCQHCRKRSSEKITVETGELLSWQATGCEHCLGGYYGRMGIYEMLLITPQIQQALLENQSSTALSEIACRQGMKTLLTNGLALVEQGVTSLSELYRTLDPQLTYGISHEK